MENNFGKFGNNIEELNQLEWINKYKIYIELYKKGLKKQAKSILLEFFEDFGKQSKAARRKFIDLVNRIAFTNKEYNSYLPTNLHEEIFKPELRNWMIDEPTNPIPFKWSHNLEDLQKSLQLDPFDQMALELFGNKIVGKISMNQHEVSSGFGYNGNPKQDLDLINFYEQFVENTVDLQQRETVKQTLFELKQTASKYLHSDLGRD